MTDHRTHLRPGPAERVRRAIGVGAVVAVGISVALGADAGANPAPEMTASVGVIGPGSRPSISGDGRYVVHEVNRDGRTTTVRVDRETGEEVELTPVPSGLRPGDSIAPVISEDGCVIVVTTELPLDLFRDDDLGDRWDVYRLLVPECEGQWGQWELVSSTPDGSARDGVIRQPAAVSATGGTIAYTAPLGGRFGAATVIEIVDVTVPISDPTRTRRAPGVPVETPATGYWHRGAWAPSLSADGTRLAFLADTTAHEALPDWREGADPGGMIPAQAFVWDRSDEDPFTRVRMLSGVGADPSAVETTEVQLSGDGSVAAFTSADPMLAGSACELDCPSQVLRVALDADRADPRWRQLVSAAPDADGVPRSGSRSSSVAGLTADGRQVLIVTRAPELLPGGVRPREDGGVGDVVIATFTEDAGLGDESEVGPRIPSLRRVTDGVQVGVPTMHEAAVISADGRTVVLATAIPEALGLDVDDEAGAGADDAAPTTLVAVTTQPRVTMASLDFGTVLVDWASDELYVSVLNEGPGLFRPAEIRLSDPRYAITETGSCTPGVVLTVGDHCTVTVVFTPDVEGPVDAELVVAEQGYGAVEVSGAVRGAGGEPTLQANPAGVDFGIVTIHDQPVTAEFAVENVGWVTATIAGIAIDGADREDYAIASETCSGRDLEPREHCLVQVTFSPGQEGRRTALVAVTTITGEHTAAILGGVGQYVPAVLVPDPVVAAGGSLGLALGGFPADVDVTISLHGQARALGTVRTDAEGRALAVVEVPRRAPAGSRMLVLSGPDDHRTSTTIEIQRSGSRTLLPGSPGSGMG